MNYMEYRLITSCMILELLLPLHITNCNKMIHIGYSSIFTTLLAFDDQTVIGNAKFVILLSSLVAGIIGFIS